MRSSGRIATCVTVSVACLALISCSESASSDAGVVRPRIRLPVLHDADLLATGRLTALVRVAHRGRVRVAATLRADGRRAVALGTPRRVTLAPSRWRPVQILLSRSGRAALTRCPQARVVASVVMPFAKAKRATTPLRLDPPDCVRFFSGNGFWNAPIGRGAPLDPSSDHVVSELLRRVQMGYAHGPPPSINTAAYTPPIYTVGRSQPRVKVRLDRPAGYSPSLESAFRSVPLPSSARSASGADGELVLWQPATGTMWEFWQLRRAADGWHASWGGRLENVMSGPGTYPNPRVSWGTSASGLPLAGGLILPHELAQRRIDHVLALGVPGNRVQVFALPAQRTDGTSRCDRAPVEGARFRLDPKLDVASLHLPATVDTIARTAQRYGIVVREQSAAVVFYAQSASTFARDPYPALFGGQGANDLLRSFPWSRLQLMKMNLVKSQGKTALPDLGGLLGHCG